MTDDCINFQQRESWMIDDRKMISKVGDEWRMNDKWQEEEWKKKMRGWEPIPKKYKANKSMRT
jgi:hypothetical protein